MKNMLPKNLEAVFLDFDGVVLESADIKTQAFYELYVPYGKAVALKAKEYHVEHQGVNRSKKFIEIHKRYLNQTCADEELKLLSDSFSKIVFQKIIDCNFVEGIIDFLEHMVASCVPTYLLSATPHGELVNICNTRDIIKYFKKMYGAPYDKSQVGIKLIEEFNYSRDKVVFIGDSISDFEAASAIGVNFIGRVAKNMVNPFSKNTKIIDNFANIK